MSNDHPKMSSWAIFRYGRNHLGRSMLYAIFGKKNARSVDRYCEDPKFTCREEHESNPLDWIKDFLTALDNLGHVGVVRAAVAYVLSGTSIECGYSQEVSDLLPTMPEEKLADYTKVSELHKAIENHWPIDKVSNLKHAALQEIERTVAKYMESER